jgi:hypothetical protein
VRTCELHGVNGGTRGGDSREGPPNKEQGDCMGDSSLQSHSGANPNPKTAKDKGNVPKGGEAGGVALTVGVEQGLASAYRLRPPLRVAPIF